ncbi:hypothetical protein Cthiooxydans_37920 [Comamonas thiooxydans]|uniref:Uncharacterized protein n=1 Tax=Comamonas testosteroni TK102 TaxID=1392005 RepID=A0A076PNT9_COMTE|nr:hypothetical protein O987_22000 [Comamonas testosteroni TK102]BDB71380.1 hypothetical protein Cthiooxydans_37920 [Comamonas thiooxydans]
MLAKVSMDGLATPLSIAEMYVLSTCASKAKVSWDLSAACRHCFTRRPKAMEIGAAEEAEEVAERLLVIGGQDAHLQTN